MSAARQELQEALCRYTKITLNDINGVRGFCEMKSSWMDARKSELTIMNHIKEKQSEIKDEAFWKSMKSKFTQESADSRCAELEEELATVLEETQDGLEDLDCFLDAVEKLAVTSLHVFMEENQVLRLPKGISLEHVRLIIIAARLICPLLLEFKRDASVFFLPKLQNIEVLSYQLEKYVQTTQEICEMFEKSSISDIRLEIFVETGVDLSVDLSEDDGQRMLHHINQLHDIRMNKNFRMVFLFQEVSCSGFINEFSERQSRMKEFLDNLEQCAVQLDRMNKGAKISSVTGSSVGAIGGVLSIAGLALIPFTAGLSLGLTMTGVGMGVASGVNSAVTTATELGVNRTQQKKASEIFESFMEDVKSVHDCLDKVTNQTVTKIEGRKRGVALGVGKVIGKLGAVGKSIDAFVDAASALKLLRNEELIASAGKVVAQEGKALRSVSKVAADLPDIGQAAVKGPLAMGKAARAGFIGLNALFVGMDIFFICKDGHSLYKGSETKKSQLIRARAALWSSEMDSWKNIHDSLCKGLKTSEEHRAVLEKTFYP